MLPGGEAPEYTEGREGYYWVKQLQGNSARTVLKLDIRDFSEEGYHARKTFVRQLAESACALWGEGSVICQLSDRYANVFNSLQGEGHYPIDIALRAYQRCGITPTPVAMRGGYDGAVLSQKDYPARTFLPAHIISILSMNIFQSVHFGRQVMWLLPSFRRHSMGSPQGIVSHD